MSTSELSEVGSNPSDQLSRQVWYILLLNTLLLRQNHHFKLWSTPLVSSSQLIDGLGLFSRRLVLTFRQGGIYQIW